MMRSESVFPLKHAVKDYGLFSVTLNFFFMFVGLFVYYCVVLFFCLCFHGQSLNRAHQDVDER